MVTIGNKPGEANNEINFRFSGVFDLDALYKNIQDWFSDHKFLFQEKLHKFKPPELELEFVGDRKEDGYRLVHVEVSFHFWYYKELVIKKEGKEKKMVSSSFLINMRINQVYDYDNLFSTPFKRKLQKFLHRFVWFYKINVLWNDQAYYELEDLYKLIKNSVNTTTK